MLTSLFSLIGTIVLILVILIILAKSLILVHSGEVKVLERFGNYTRTLKPGLHLVVPIVYSVRQKVSIRQTPLQLEPFKVITKENAMIQTEVSLKYHVSDVESYVYKNENSEKSVALDCQSILRGIIGGMELNDVLNGTETINNQLFKDVRDISENYGVIVDRINIGEITPSDEVLGSMNKLITANRNKEAMITEADGAKQQMIRQAEGRAEQITIDAKAQAEQVRIAAEAEANRILTIASAHAKQVTLVNEAIKASDIDDHVVQYLGLDTMKTLADGQATTIIIPSNLTELAGIPMAKQLWDASKSKDAGSPQPNND